jgi:lipopolysaccharide exporter
MDELDIAAVTKKSVHAVFALISRTIIIQIINSVVGFLLFIFLSPSAIGDYFVVSAIIAFLAYFSDIGLAGALIQKKEKVTQEDLKTTFTIQQILVVIVVLLAFLCLPLVQGKLNLNASEVLLYKALVIAFFLSSLKTIPSIILERKLDFTKLVIPQVIENIVFNITVLIFAIKGFNVTSYTFAVLARGVVGLISIYIISPWKIEFGFSKTIAKRLVRFGIPFQANSVLALIKDDALIVYTKSLLPAFQMGYIDFAQTWAFLPLRLIMDNIIRITFPSFSRLQHDEKYLGIAVEKSLFVLSLLIFPMLVGLSILLPYFIHLIPKLDTKWDPAIGSIIFFAINAGLSSISTPLTNALNAIGKIKITLNLMIFWTITTWILTPLCIRWFGFNGFAIASAIIAFSVGIVIYITKKYIQFSIINTTLAPLIASAIMGVVLFFSSPYLVTNIYTLILAVILGGIVYTLSMYLIAKEQLLADLAVIKKQFVKAS